MFSFRITLLLGTLAYAPLAHSEACIGPEKMTEDGVSYWALKKNGTVIYRRPVGRTKQSSDAAFTDVLHYKTFETANKEGNCKEDGEPESGWLNPNGPSHNGDDEDEH